MAKQEMLLRIVQTVDNKRYINVLLQSGGQQLIIMEQEENQSPPYTLHVGMLKNIDLNLYPKEKTHYLAYALQFGLKPPSKATMMRSERRNMIKSGAKKAAEATGRLNNVDPTIIRIKKKRFTVPDRFGEIIAKNLRGGRRRGGMRSRGKGHQKVAVKNPVFLPGRVIPSRKPISLPVQIVRKEKNYLKPKAQIKAFHTRSPSWLELRAERERFREEIQKYRTEHKIEGIEQEKKIPEYFRKKKANQKRRRQQKHKLIKENKQALLKLFGTAIFSKGWPISRREIKLALGIQEEDLGKDISLDALMSGESNSMKAEK